MWTLQWVEDRKCGSHSNNAVFFITCFKLGCIATYRFRGMAWIRSASRISVGDISFAAQYSLQPNLVLPILPLLFYPLFLYPLFNCLESMPITSLPEAHEENSECLFILLQCPPPRPIANGNLWILRCTISNRLFRSRQRCLLQSKQPPSSTAVSGL